MYERRNGIATSSCTNHQGSIRAVVSRNIAVSLAVLALANACSVGAPKILNEGNTDRILAMDCKNVSKDQPIGKFYTDSYMTTGSSAFGEAWRSEFPDNEVVTVGSTVLGRMPAENTFCMVYGADFDEVNAVVSMVLDSLGMELIVRDANSGEYETEFVYREPPADLLIRNPNLKWREKYLIFVSSNLIVGTDVRIYRDIAIAREKVDSEDERRYYSATSVGRNESWILLSINEMLH